MHLGTAQSHVETYYSLYLHIFKNLKEKVCMQDQRKGTL